MKTLKLFILSLLLILAFSTGVKAEFFSDVIVTSANGIWTDSRAYSTLNAAITAVGANQRTVVVASPQTVTALTVPANVTLKFERDGSIANSGQLTINTLNIIADNHQIFTGAGDVDFVQGTIVKSSWFNGLYNALTLTSDDTVTMLITKQETLHTSVAVGNNVTLKWDSQLMLGVAAGITLSNIGQVEAGTYQIFSGAGSFRFRDGTNLNSAWFISMRAIINHVSTSRVTLTLQGTLLVDYTDTVPTNLHIDVDSQRGLLSLSAGITLTINSNIQAGPYQWLSGTGTVVLPSVVAHYPEWYSSGTFTQATIASALTAIGTTNKVTLLLRPGTWVISSNVDWSTYTNVTFKIVPGAVISKTGFTLKLPPDTYLTPQMFSADGFDTTAVCEAMNTGYASGAEVVFPAGTYTVAAASMPTEKYASAMRGVGSVTINLSGAVVWTIKNGFSIENINFTTTYTYANATGTYYHTFTTGAAGATTPRLYDVTLKNINYSQTTVTDGTARGYGFVQMAGGVTRLKAENIFMEGIREGIVIDQGSADGVSGYNGDAMCDGATFENVHGKNMQRVILPGSPSYTNGYFASTNVIINNFSLVNTAAQALQYSGGARTGHSPIIGDMGIGGSITNARFQWSIEHAMYVAGSRLKIEGVYGANGEDIKIVGYSKTATSSATITGVDWNVSYAQNSVVHPIFTMNYVNGIKISNVRFKGLNTSATGNAIRPYSVAVISKSAKNIDISDVIGQYLMAGVLVYESDESWEEAFENISIRNCKILDPATPTTASYYAAANKYLTYYPDNAGAHATWVAGDPLIKNIVIKDNYFAETTATIDTAETTKPMGVGAVFTSTLLGLINVMDIQEIRCGGNVIDGWYGGSNQYRPIEVNTAASGNKGYTNGVYIDETMISPTSHVMGSMLYNMASVSGGSKITWAGKPVKVGDIEYMNSSMSISKGHSGGAASAEIETPYRGSSVEGSTTLQLAAGESVATALYLPYAVGVIEFATDQAEYGIGTIASTGTVAAPVSLHVSANGYIGNTDTGAKVCAFRASGDYLTLKNNTAATQIITFKYRITYN